MSKDIIQTKHGRLFRKGDLCHFSSSVQKKSWLVSAWKKETEKKDSIHKFESTDLWILFSVVVVGDSLEDIVLLHPSLGKLTVPIGSDRIMLVCPAKPCQEKVGGNNE